MSAGVCGKRLGFEEIFGSSSSSPTSSSSKRFRCSSFGSPIRSSEFGFGSEDKLYFLINMFPSMDRELVESVLKTHNHKIDDAVDSLRALCLGDVRPVDVTREPDSMATSNNSNVSGAESSQFPQQKVQEQQDNSIEYESTNPTDGPSWVDIFVQEMMNASDMDDAQGRAARILEAFEKSVVAHSRASDEHELISLKEHLQSLLRDNHILKRAVSIQHERNLEQEEKTREVEQLKLLINQYQEQHRALEINNYTLKLHLQRAQESSSIPGHFHPDVL
ncbi:Ubiquitin system component cue protein [Thalictrum thalictroides]|uniref:Ubiquitin system component cue protein n=1 Tax=Thalictrum thalictroides TaxID=46969 RepID=A0A7J6UVB6_THATH|nr:Ubiquitin system component cue protein [Thalictrum thalictroides]